jgi:hypothetical protein
LVPSIVELLAELYLLLVPAGGGKRQAATTAVPTATFNTLLE